MNTQSVNPSLLANRASNAVIPPTFMAPGATANGSVDAISAFPFPRDTIKGWIQEKVWNLTNQWIDPDKVYLHQFAPANSTHTGSAVTGWEHRGTPESSMTLTDAVASDFFSAERYGTAGKAQALAHFVSSNTSPFSLLDSESVPDFFSRLGKFIFDRTGPGYLYSKIHDDVPAAVETWRDLDAVYGLYLDGPEKGTYDAGNQLRMKPSELLNLVREGDLQKKVMTKLDSFWTQHGDEWRVLAKQQFVMEARAARALNQQDPGRGLSPQAYAEVMKAAASGVPLEGPVSGAQLQAQTTPDPNTKVFGLDINGYQSNDILRFVSKSGTETLYVPGAKPAIQTFKDRAAVDQWVLEQSRDPAKAKALEEHFSLRDRQQGVFGALSADGVDATLTKLGAGTQAANDRVINTRNYPIGGDVFSFMASQTRQRIDKDADTEMKSNAEVRKDDALALLQAGNAVFSIPMALLGPIGLALGAASYTAQVGMEIDQAVEGDTQAERKSGLHSAVMDVATMAFFHALGKAGPSTADPAVESGAQPTTGDKPFFNYRRVNGQIGVLMSPNQPPRLPETPGGPLNPAWDPSMEIYLQAGSKRPSVQPRYEIVEEAAPAAKKPKVEDSEHELSDNEESPSSVASNATSSGDYEPYDDSSVLKVNPFKDGVTLPAGGYFNSRGMIERTDIPKLYRVEKADRVERRGDPEDDGFRDSNFFSGPEKMMEGNVVVASRSKAAAMHFGDTEFDGKYHLYEIDSRGVPVVSFNENIEANPQFVEARQCVAPDTLERMRKAGNLDEFANDSYKFDEVHVDNDQLSSGRIRRIPRY
ncbi:dermonecrotic toxin domain-containing protein [Pseudomonas orientalis]|uniref:dermonecrotic toxin domain-containing protein n=1 Tax=Pseudomonas orientalis TaxID=76758 RepID=UPI002FE241D6